MSCVGSRAGRSRAQAWATLSKRPRGGASTFLINCPETSVPWSSLDWPTRGKRATRTHQHSTEEERWTCCVTECEIRPSSRSESRSAVVAGYTPHSSTPLARKKLSGEMPAWRVSDRGPRPALLALRPATTRVMTLLQSKLFMAKLASSFCGLLIILAAFVSPRLCHRAPLPPRSAFGAQWPFRK